MTVNTTIEFEIPYELLSGFPGLLDKIRKHVIRQALRSAMVEPKNLLKANLLSLPHGDEHKKGSAQSSGASARAVNYKYGQLKSNPNVFFSIAGVNTKSREAIWPHEKSPVYRGANVRQVNFGIRNSRPGKDGIRAYSKRWQPGEVRSTLRRRYGLKDTKKGLSQRFRKPNRYWHLVEFGFSGTDKKGPWAGKRTRTFQGHHFVQKTLTSTMGSAKTMFINRVKELIRKVS